MAYNKKPHNKDFKEAVITKCLTEKCEDCPGSYINRIFEHRLTCKCPCGHNNKGLNSIKKVEQARFKSQGKNDQFYSGF
jgi:hypothetical protein